MKALTKQEYLLKMLTLMLQGDVVIEAGHECYHWPTDANGVAVRTVPAERFEFYICARTDPRPDGLLPAQPLPLEALLRTHCPELFATRLEQKLEQIVEIDN